MHLRNLPINLALIAASLVAALLVLELGLRVVLPKYELAAEMPFERDSLRISSRPANARGMVHHPDRPRRHAVIYNNLGLRQHRDIRAADLDGAVNVGFFGDSFTENLRVAAPYAFTEPLDYLLNASGQRATVLNFGQGGYATDQAYLAYEYAPVRDELDYVFYVVCANDLKGLYDNNLFFLDQDGDLRRNPAMASPLWLRVASRLHVTYLILDAYHTLFPPKNPWDVPSARALQERSMADAVRERAHSARAQAIVDDWRMQTGNADLDRSIALFRALIRKWRAGVEDRGGHFALVLLPRPEEGAMVRLIDPDFEVIDLYRHFQDTVVGYDWNDWRFENDGHWNEAANLKAAIRLYRHLERELALPAMTDDDLDRALATYYAAFDDGWSPEDLPAPPAPGRAGLRAIAARYSALEATPAGLR